MVTGQEPRRQSLVADANPALYPFQGFESADNTVLKTYCTEPGELSFGAFTACSLAKRILPRLEGQPRWVGLGGGVDRGYMGSGGVMVTRAPKRMAVHTRALIAGTNARPVHVEHRQDLTLAR